ncbi:MAG TPA: hypothetical protein VJB66_04295 [Candidatus Nanoarchaeia archaeon]|nr:hypothetical protein [Candidatus Nanoarchaeia archaeon]
MVYNCFGGGYGMMSWAGWGGIFGLLYLLIVVGLVVLLYLWIVKLWRETQTKVKRK